jgi:hypothetical protein
MNFLPSVRQLDRLIDVSEETMGADLRLRLEKSPGEHCDVPIENFFLIFFEVSLDLGVSEEAHYGVHV